MEKGEMSQAHDEPQNIVARRMPRLILASNSPRRAEILRFVNWPFAKHPVDIDESRATGESAVAYVERLARAKATGALAHFSNGELALGADTTVVVDEEILCKPIDAADARRMLRLLRGRWHEVITGIALVKSEGGEVCQSLVAHQTTRVRFARMTDEEIDWYVAMGEPMDKAGAYAVQGLAALFIEEIAGDYWNVVGLPLRLLYQLASDIVKNA
jgi:septum formation protein